MFEILNGLCAGIQRFQNSDFKIDNKMHPYNVGEKVDDISILLSEENKKLAKKVIELIPSIRDFYMNAKIPFRDANPKNYILRNLEEREVKHANNFNMRDIVNIDFSTLNSLTFRIDDFISIIFHYMIDNDVRTELMKKYKIDFDTKENILTAFVRFGRFWLRRRYSPKYFPNLFRVRYRDENTDFYNKSMMEFTEKAIQFFSS